MSSDILSLSGQASPPFTFRYRRAVKDKYMRDYRWLDPCLTLASGWWVHPARRRGALTSVGDRAVTGVWRLGRMPN